MEILQTTTITLEEKEQSALETLRDAYTQCVCNDCFECVQCPLYVNGICIGQYCEKALDIADRKAR